MKKIIASEKNAEAIGPYSAGVEIGDLLFFSGQLGLTKEGNMISDDVAEQTEQVFKNITNLLEKSNIGYENILKTTIFISDMNDFATINEIYGKYFTKPYPARSCVQVAKLPKDGKVEIEFIAKKW